MGAPPLLLVVVALTAIVLTTPTAFAASPRQHGITSIDHDRLLYIRLESDLWARLDTTLSGADALLAIFEAHTNFTQSHLPVGPQPAGSDTNEFIVMNRIYEWMFLEQKLRNVNSLFEAYRKTLESTTAVDAERAVAIEFSERALLDLAETILSEGPGSFEVAAVLDEIENVMVKQSLYYKTMLEAHNQVCATRQSAQQVLYQLYATISLTELKGYSMMQFSWMLLKSYGKGNFSREAQLMRLSFEERARKTQTLLRTVMQRADRQVWRCDPVQHVEGETYVAVTRLMQGYIENEVDMNTDNTCRENCAAYQFAENHGCFKDQYCAKQPRCAGKILNCQFVDADMWICPSKWTSNRRYEYIEYENGRTLGQKGTCTRGTTKVDSWWRWIFWHCSYCLCMCDEQGVKSDRYFSLRESVSNVTANRVVTGLRFSKINRIIHIQIQEGALMPRGAINASSVEWRPVAEYRLSDRAIRNGEDYHTMSWDRRAVDTDDLIAPAQHVVTGVRFRTLGTHLNLEIRITEADFETGQLLDTAKSYWHSKDNTETSEQKRTPVTLRRADVPTRTRSKSVPTSVDNQYVEFGPSDIDKDLAQTTVPYLDSQDVVSIPPVALSGAGLLYKGQDGYGGFVAPKLFTYDFAPHIEVPTAEAA